MERFNDNNSFMGILANKVSQINKLPAFDFNS
jgi:hypothetical protein